MQQEDNNNKCDKPHNIVPFSYDYLSSTQILLLEENISSISLYHNPTLSFLLSFIHSVPLHTSLFCHITYFSILLSMNSTYYPSPLH